MRKYPARATPAPPRLKNPHDEQVEDETNDRAHIEAVDDALYQLAYIRRFTYETRLNGSVDTSSGQQA